MLFEFSTTVCFSPKNSKHSISLFQTDTKMYWPFREIPEPFHMTDQDLHTEQVQLSRMYCGASCLNVSIQLSMK